MNPFFIALYGINNIGKSTQAQLLVKRLQAEGFATHYVKYPVYDLKPSGTFLNEVLRGGSDQKISEEELQMWFTVNRFQMQAQVEEWLAAGDIVVAEDYIGTGLAWGATKGANVTWLEELNRPLRRPDLEILMDGERFLTGKETGHLHEENDVLMQKCRDMHLSLGARFDWNVISSEGERDEVSERVCRLVESRLPR